MKGQNLGKKRRKTKKKNPKPQSKRSQLKRMT